MTISNVVRSMSSLKTREGRGVARENDRTLEEANHNTRLYLWGR